VEKPPYVENTEIVRGFSRIQQNPSDEETGEDKKEVNAGPVQA
jgi:hypothetical protein